MTLRRDFVLLFKMCCSFHGEYFQNFTDLNLLLFVATNIQLTQYWMISMNMRNLLIAVFLFALGTGSAAADNYRIKSGVNANLVPVGLQFSLSLGHNGGVKFFYNGHRYKPRYSKRHLQKRHFSNRHFSRKAFRHGHSRKKYFSRRGYGQRHFGHRSFGKRVYRHRRY